ncbi:TIGR03749 family integrating conjugative element protein [Burkholderia pyrrocinia]|uniref:TIGR03749 family integrating conjugative element protein n=1 Tax=Burkholderia pyrrocinia TaxID=60550 RepID=UPI001FB47680|nr:TIGR03749 family integrating conjugative element protein [Burkholderia pyrrocinia]UOB57006.1 TIGR03749 family integrating conjugative element protein [Burkholderia pyrrocinia]
MKRLLVLLAIGLPLTAQAVEILRWERMPLAVPLRVNQERVVFIDRNVRVGVPAELDGKLRVQSAGGAIYLRANDVIEPSRLQLQDADTGALILLDIAATPARKDQPALEPVRIVEGDSTPKRYGATGKSPGGEEADTAEATERRTRESPVPVVLTRYAAQNLFAPLRTIESVEGIGRAHVRRDLPLGSLLPSLPVQPHALAAWQLDGFWVTAVRLRNASRTTLPLDPRALQGDFVAATFQHPDLGPAGHASDTTVVYLVTRGHGLAESLLPAISPFDTALNLPTPTAGGHDEK